MREFIKEQALLLGFDDAGMVPAGPLQKEMSFLNQWLLSGYGEGLSYMARNTDKRTNPMLMFPECRSLVVAIINYRQKQHDSCISEYGCGRDYHIVLKEKLWELNARMAEKAGTGYVSRLFTDSSPVMEKPWAVRAGLGMQGRHTLVIHPHLGTKFYIGGILCNVETEAAEPSFWDPCAGCRLCIDSCPTGALEFPGVLVAHKCIAYQTIENKGEIPAEIAGVMKDSIYGCDICQNVCPCNQIGTKTTTVFKPRPHSLLSAEEWRDITDEMFQRLCHETVMERSGPDKIRQTAALIVQNRKA